MSKKIKLRKKLKDALYDKYYGENGGQGVSKHAVKLSGEKDKTIHSRNTLKTYMQQADRFCNWCYAKNIRDFDQAKDTIKDYLQEMSKDKSAWTVYTAAAALAKVYDCGINDFDYVLPKRERKSVRRSRIVAQRDARFSPKENAQLILFGQCMGLRRAEMEALHGNDLRYHDGKYYVKVGKAAKGGKPRMVRIVGDEKEVKTIIRAMQLASDGLVFNYIHSAADIHYYRSVYACRLYKKECRDNIPKEDRYICRKDKAGIIYDKKAMLICSKNLGHNRISVVAESYLHNL